MAADQPGIAKTFPVKPKLKPISKKSTPESKYWKSFKTQPTQTVISSITSLSFSPISPHDFAATHSATVTIFSSQTLEPKSTISSFSDTATSASFRSDGRLIAAGSHSGLVQVFDAKSRNPLRRLRGHSRPVHLVRYPRIDKLHLFSGGDDAIVKYWDVTSETPIAQFIEHKDYVRCGDGSPASDDMFVTGSYDHRIKLWDVRVSSASSVMEVNHGKPVEDVIFLPSGGEDWKDRGEEAQQYRILSVSLDGYMKVFDYAKFKVTYSMRFPSPLLSIGFSPDCLTRVIGTSNGIIYAGKRKTKKNVGSELGNFVGLGPIEEPPKRVLRPSSFKYFRRGQNEKPSEGDFLIMRPKKVKLAEHDKLLKKFTHKEAFVSALRGKNPDIVVAVMEELVARKKLLRCVSNLETEELGLLLGFLQKYSTMPKYAGLLLKLAKKVLEMRAEDVRSSDVLKGHIRNLKRSVDEEIRIQQSLQEIQGILSPLLRIAGRR
ncbi:hypothetical protein TEA_023861 [Camellia sinensis var. sinensis]|uniref:U3 small nucleolar RNA-associated protein 15 C-terminal domain-containing protein n=1 Tax=Camellia sinensis var. sinensis TaxID=542762 RepID=A0A4S4EH89_CAMSN|nr:hypothetical protein TEA_023861 [Camellia sinensis var. sinensis]